MSTRRLSGRHEKGVIRSHLDMIHELSGGLNIPLPRAGRTSGIRCSLALGLRRRGSRLRPPSRLAPPPHRPRWGKRGAEFSALSGGGGGGAAPRPCGPRPATPRRSRGCCASGGAAGDPALRRLTAGPHGSLPSRPSFLLTFLSRSFLPPPNRGGGGGGDRNVWNTRAERTARRAARGPRRLWAPLGSSSSVRPRWARGTGLRHPPPPPEPGGRWRPAVLGRRESLFCSEKYWRGEQMGAVPWQCPRSQEDAVVPSVLEIGARSQRVTEKWREELPPSPQLERIVVQTQTLAD
ncbi:translation initiation factor IF-2-like [Phacochoerus africanus]|uniref:translation initiation factor IF-2-like n=1 Tax=Phacochoerus africanus TaxID=41426 RepID=UPI001FD88138|nr:translation initiation factor IF-2-like [Phacochoerus africanus]